ncbi:hypothetical protein CCR75_006518 [Bremia lactucae]|uniref:Uncharacterized protein n=1 Tax=Bremia lactucae TaxID=4779 RepID=A0A976FPF4_BRELC|nr:hypothetical protein CCR75_006518 [Bremia lactucae]
MAADERDQEPDHLPDNDHEYRNNSGQRSVWELIKHPVPGNWQIGLGCGAFKNTFLMMDREHAICSMHFRPTINRRAERPQHCGKHRATCLAAAAGDVADGRLIADVLDVYRGQVGLRSNQKQTFV